jgi:hypothetical protein
MTSLYCVVEDQMSAAGSLKEGFGCIHQWSSDWELRLMQQKLSPCYFLGNKWLIYPPYS